MQHDFADFPKGRPWEVKLAIKQSKKEKAPGPDNITIDMIEEAEKPRFLKNGMKRSSFWRPQEHFQLPSNKPFKKHLQTLFTKVITNLVSSTLDRNQPRK